MLSFTQRYGKGRGRGGGMSLRQLEFYFDASLSLSLLLSFSLRLIVHLLFLLHLKELLFIQMEYQTTLPFSLCLQLFILRISIVIPFLRRQREILKVIAVICNQFNTKCPNVHSYFLRYEGVICAIKGYQKKLCLKVKENFVIEDAPV